MVKTTAAQLMESCAGIVARDRWFTRLTGLDVPVRPCPAREAFADAPGDGPRRLANLMPNAGHYPIMGQGEADIWNANVGEIARVLLANGFAGIAHDQTEAEFMRSLGFEDVTVYDGDLERFMQVYRECGTWFGNRIHGAIAAVGAGAQVLCVGIDSRIDAVAVAGGDVATPSQMGIAAIVGGIERWITA